MELGGCSARSARRRAIHRPAFCAGIRAYTFLAVLVLLALELTVIGVLVNGRPAGAFIDNRNRISLSKLQAAAWTVVVLGAFSTTVAFNAAYIGSSTVTLLNVNIHRRVAPSHGDLCDLACRHARAGSA